MIFGFIGRFFDVIHFRIRNIGFWQSQIIFKIPVFHSCRDVIGKFRSRCDTIRKIYIRAIYLLNLEGRPVGAVCRQTSESHGNLVIPRKNVFHPEFHFVFCFRRAAVHIPVAILARDYIRAVLKADFAACFSHRSFCRGCVGRNRAGCFAGICIINIQRRIRWNGAVKRRSISRRCVRRNFRAGLHRRTFCWSRNFGRRSRFNFRLFLRSWRRVGSRLGSRLFLWSRSLDIGALRTSLVSERNRPQNARRADRLNQKQNGYKRV